MCTAAKMGPHSTPANFYGMTTTAAAAAASPSSKDVETLEFFVLSLGFEGTIFSIEVLLSKI